MGVQIDARNFGSFKCGTGQYGKYLRLAENFNIGGSSPQARKCCSVECCSPLKTLWWLKGGCHEEEGRLYSSLQHGDNLIHFLIEGHIRLPIPDILLRQSAVYPSGEKFAALGEVQHCIGPVRQQACLS